MNINAILKKEGIEVKSQLDESQINRIANIISEKICNTFPEHNLNQNDIFSMLSTLTMFIAKMPADSTAAKYFSKINAIYFSDTMNLENLDTLVIHECLHAIQEVKNPNGKLLKLGLYDFSSNRGQGINEAAVQLMSTKIAAIEEDTVKYYNLNFHTPSPLFYPIETALINQMTYFTGTYPLFHSTLYSNYIFKNTFIAKSNEKVYHTIEKNFDLIIHYEELLSFSYAELADYSKNNASLNKIKKLNTKIDSIKNFIFNVTLSTQKLIVENCFNTELDNVRDTASLKLVRERLYTFNSFLFMAENNDFYSKFYCEMMNKLEEKEELINKHGVLNYLNDLQTDLLDLTKDQFGFNFFRRLFNKLKLLFEEAIREKN